MHQLATAKISLERDFSRLSEPSTAQPWRISLERGLSRLSEYSSSQTCIIHVFDF